MVVWAPSRHCFLVGKSQKGKVRKSFHIQKKASKNPRTMVKWLVFTKRAIQKFLETGEVVVAKPEVIDAMDTDEEV